MIVGGEVDIDNELVVASSANYYTASIKSYYGTINFNIFQLIIYDPKKDKEIRYPKVFQHLHFRDYGKLKNFNLRLVRERMFATIPRSYLPRLLDSPIIPEDNIKENIDRIYGIKLIPKPPYVFDMYKLYIYGMTGKIIINTYEESEVTKVMSMLEESQVIGIEVQIRNTDVTFLLLVDDNTKTLLNKLIYIYTHISDFLKKKGITLKDILEDIDLYVAIAAAAATAT
jgi:hypothetical protein